MVINVIESIIVLLSAWVALSVGCELRDYKGGHRFIGSFYAKTAFQKLFTKWQRRTDIRANDLGRLTYLGYTGVLISAFFSLFAIPFSIYQFIIGNHDTGAYMMSIWGGASAIWGIFAMVVQGVDSLINRF